MLLTLGALPPLLPLLLSKAPSAEPPLFPPKPLLRLSLTLPSKLGLRGLWLKASQGRTPKA